VPTFWDWPALQTADIISNCANPAVGGSNSATGFTGVPVAFIQNNPSLSSVSAGNASLTAETSDAFTVGAVWSKDIGANWIESFTFSLDYYDTQVDDAVQGRDPSDVLAACVDTLDPLFCDLTPRAVSGALDVIDNQLQNIGSIESSGFDLMLNYLSPEFGWGQLDATLTASFLEDFIELTEDINGGVSKTVRTGTHTNETFQRAFPELRWNLNVGWEKERWNGGLAFRYTDGMDLSGDTKVDSAMFTDVRLSYMPNFAGDAVTITLGINNVFDEDPPICFPCGVIGMSTVVHDLPGTVGYLRVSYQN